MYRTGITPTFMPITIDGTLSQHSGSEESKKVKITLNSPSSNWSADSQILAGSAAVLASEHTKFFAVLDGQPDTDAHSIGADGKYIP